MAASPLADARFWEARLLWGGVTAAARKLCLLVLSSVQPAAPRRAAHLLACLRAFPLALARLCTGSTAPLPPSAAAVEYIPRLLPALTRSEGRRSTEEPRLLEAAGWHVHAHPE